MENDKTGTSQKNSSKKNVTFCESIDVVKLNSSKEIKQISNNNKSNNKEEESDNIIMNNQAFIRRHSVCLEELGNTKKRMAKRYSLRCKSLKEVSPLKRKSDLGVIKEIVLGDGNEKVFTKNPKILYGYKDDGEEGKKKIKINIIEELRKFDREQQMKMEKFIDKRNKQKNDLIFKSSKIFKLIKPKNDENDEIKGFMDERKNDDKNQDNEKDSVNDSSEGKNDKNIDNKNNNKNGNDRTINGKKNILKNKKNKMNNNSNGKNDFLKVKEKYFSPNIYSIQFPETEYRIKYLDNYFRNDSIKKNLFGKNNNDNNNENINGDINNNIDMNQNININNYNIDINYNNNINNNKSKIHNNSNIQSNENASSMNINNNITNDNNRNYINIYQYIYKPTLSQKRNLVLQSKINNIASTDFTNTLIDTNNKCNHKTEQSINTNIYLMSSNRNHKRSESDDYIDNTYQLILNSIDEKLYYKYKNKTIISRGNKNNIDYSTIFNTIKNYSTDLKRHNNIFRRPSFQVRKSTNKNYYKNICDKYDKYNGLNMTSHFTRNKNNNNKIRNYKFFSVMNKINGIKQFLLSKK